MMLDYFTRYDLDGSGTINSNEELKQLCTNLVVKLELDMDVKTIDEYVTKAGNMESLCWAFDAFQEWFVKQFEPNASWKPNDMSSSDEENTEAPGVPRQGSYDLVMSDGTNEQKSIFKLRYEDDTCKTLFKRVCNDETLGYIPGSDGLKPAGLHSIVGSFDLDSKTCKFKKSYDVDYNEATKEPIFEFNGKIESHCKITGTWENTETDPACKPILEKLGLSAGQGTFTMIKKEKSDE